MTDPLISARNLGRVFSFGSERITAIHGIDLAVYAGQLMIITGRSGSGKTTLLNILAGLDSPTSGNVYIRGHDLAQCTDMELTQLRRVDIGFVFQSFGLLPLLSAYENVELPLRIAGWKRSEQPKRTEACLDLVGLKDRANHRPYELSGGERQRIAIARAIVHKPCIILADEPTGELDSMTGAAIFKLLREIVDKENVAIIVTTHDTSVTPIADITIQLSDGTIVG